MGKKREGRERGVCAGVKAWGGAWWGRVKLETSGVWVEAHGTLALKWREGGM